MNSAAGLRLCICTDTYAPQLNGVARTLERLARAVEERGGAVQVLTTADSGAVADARVTRVPAAPFWLYPQLKVAAPSARAARKVFDAFRPNVVHAATPFGVGLAARAAAQQMALPFVTSYHTHFTAYLKFYKLQALTCVSWPFLRWFHNGGSLTFAPSETVRRELDAHGFRNARLWTRGVDAARFNPGFRSEGVRASLSASDDHMVVLYVGRLAAEKGLDPLLKGVGIAMAQHAGRMVFVLTGDGPAEARARSRAPRGSVFTGPLTGDALSRMYASADILVFPSLTETFGNVVLEAMASGIAVIAPNRGPTTDFAGDGTVLLCDVADPHAIAACISRLVTDDGLRTQLASGALGAAQERSWEAIFDGLIAEYRRVAGACGASETLHPSQSSSQGSLTGISGISG